MTAPRPETLPYRPCVGIMVLNGKGKVWAGRRLVGDRGEMEGAARLWQMPQGGIDKGEEPAEAARRELFEETGMHTVSFVAESAHWIHYDLPDNLIGVALKGKFRGQKQRWFVFRFEGSDDEIAIDPPPEGHSAEFDQWDWVEIDRLLDLIVPFKRDVYRQVIAEFRHLTAERAG